MSTCYDVKNYKSLSNSETSHDIVTTVSKSNGKINDIENRKSSLSSSEVTVDSENSENILKRDDEKVVSDSENDESFPNNETSHDLINIMSTKDGKINDSENDEYSMENSEIILNSVNSENALKNDALKIVGDIQNDQSFTNSEVSSFTTSPLVLHLQPKNNDEENSLNVQPSKSALSQNGQENRPYLCSICDKTFKRRNHYNVHLHTHKRERPYICKTCNKGFTHHYFLKQHENIHNTEKQFTCPYCNEQFSVRRYYTRHVQLHRSKTYECDACDFKCCWLKDSIDHVKSHDFNIFTCDKCDMCFTQEMNLNLHSCFKSDEKRYSCELCPKTFRRVSNLEAHTAAHENKKTINCNICLKRFNTKSSLAVHIQSNHKKNENKPYTCQVCEKKFHKEVSLKVHERVHKKNVQKKKQKLNPASLSNIDPAPIHEFQSLVNRKQSGAAVAYLNIESPVSEQKLIYFVPGKNIKHICNICLKGFQSRHTLIIHYRRHIGDKPFKCTFCTRCFADPGDLKRHYRIHIPDQRYSCEDCNKTFTRGAYMAAHLRICPYRRVTPKITSVFSVNEESA